MLQVLCLAFLLELFLEGKEYSSTTDTYIVFNLFVCGRDSMQRYNLVLMWSKYYLLNCLFVF